MSASQRCRFLQKLWLVCFLSDSKKCTILTSRVNRHSLKFDPTIANDSLFAVGAPISFKKQQLALHSRAKTIMLSRDKRAWTHYGVMKMMEATFVYRLNRDFVNSEHSVEYKLLFFLVSALEPDNLLQRTAKSDPPFSWKGIQNPSPVAIP